MKVSKTMGLVAWLRFKSLRFADTRIFEMYAALKMLAWSIVYWGFEHYDPFTVYGRVDDYFPGWLVAIVLAPLAVSHAAGILLNCSPLRRFAIGASFLWWSWLAVLMMIEPPGYAAVITYTALATFLALSYVGARFRREVG